MNEQEALAKMVAPGTPRKGKWRGGVIQIWLTRACDKACYGCTQGSNLGGNPGMMMPEQFEQAVLSLKGYFGVYGVFGGNPATSPHFEACCEIMRKHVPFDQRGIWCNNPLTVEKAQVMRATFNPAVSNLNVHLDREAYELFRQGWPEAKPFGLYNDSRHSPPYVAMKDVLKTECSDCSGAGGAYTAQNGDVYLSDPGGLEDTWRKCETCDGVGQVYDEETAWELISNCDINQHWSAMIGVFRGQLRAWFCEVAGAQAMLHQHEPDYPDTGIPLTGEGMDRTKELEISFGTKWWQLPMPYFARQVRKHCHDCGVPLRGHGELAQARDSDLADMDGSIIQEAGKEQTSATHEAVYKPKRKGRKVELVMAREQLGDPLELMTDYVGNARR